MKNPDAYELLQQAMHLWQRNAMSNNDASDIVKRYSGIPLTIKGPVDIGYWQATNVYYDEHHGIVVEAKIEPYELKSGD